MIDPAASWDQIRRVMTNSLLIAALGSFTGGIFLGSGERYMALAGIFVLLLSIGLAIQLRPPPETIANAWLAREMDGSEGLQPGD